MQIRFPKVVLSTLLTCLTLSTPHSAVAASISGGFIEQLGITPIRAVLSRLQIGNFLPRKGSFTFPSPYNTQAIRLTNADDCNGSDCIDYVGYAYWNNTNNHRGRDTMLIFVGMDRNNGGPGPSLLEYNKTTNKVDNLGPLFEDSNSLSWASGEGWYFSDTMPTTLYVNLDSRLLRYDVMTKRFSTVFDAAKNFGKGYYIWQVHSSADDRVHSATVRAYSNYAMLGCMVYREDTGQYSYFPRIGKFDECQVDKSGEWLVIKEDVDGKDGEDNRIINIATGQERILLDRQGAAGHSDMGYGYMIAADNWARNPNTQKIWRFAENPLRGVSVYSNDDWTVSSPAHVSHSNASPSIAPEKQYACGSSANRGNSAEANEIICFTLDGSNKHVVVAPIMTDLNASGGGDDYAKYPKGNLDVTGQYFIWTANTGGGRLDAFLVKIPTQLLPGNVSAAPATPPQQAGGSGSTPLNTAVIWSELQNSSASSGSLRKISGCDGCSNAGAVSQQALATGDGYMEFTVDHTQELLFIGVSRTQGGAQANDLDFALRLQQGYLEVRENGVYRAYSALARGDVFRISVKNKKVSYSRNGKVFYTSTQLPAYPLKVYARLYSANGGVANAKVSSGS